MSSASPRLARREKLLEAARRRLRRIEIEQHRVKAFLARLEADYEDDVADWLTRKLRRRTKPATNDARIRESSPAKTNLLPFTPEKAVAGVSDPGPVVRNGFRFSDPDTFHAAESPIAPPPITIDAAAHGAPVDRRRSARAFRRTASPLLASFAVHCVVMVFCVSLTVATLIQQETPLFASPTELDETLVEDFNTVEIEKTKFDDSELTNVVSEQPEFNLADTIVHRFDPTELGAGSQDFGDIGQLDALPGDLGTLMAGTGSPGSGKLGGPLGDAVFFGARSKGDRFVFVVDNSSSMKGGRLEAATAEIMQSIDALSPKQSFYVIFVSDKTYPMFFPQRAPDLLPATEPNKKRLAAWLPKAILASGNNRKLIEAMDMAASLRPHAVFLLWDGDMKYSEKVRLEVMTHLTQPNDWRFAIHTLGMGISSLDSQQNLTMIAEAHGGTFRRVDIPTARQR